MGLASWAKDQAVRFVNEVAETVTDRIVPQGASEIAQALNTGQGFVPYGPTSEPMPEPTSMEAPSMEAAPIEAPQMEAASMEPTQSMEGPPVEPASAGESSAEPMSHVQDLERRAAMAGPEQSMEMER